MISGDAACPHCGMLYGDMRTGLTYRCIYSMLWSASDNPHDWRYKRRHTILGLWHQIKKDQWESHLRECESIQQGLENKRLNAEEAEAEREARMAADMYPDDAAEVPLFDWDVPF